MLAPGIALPPTALPTSWGGPIPRCGLYTPVSMQEQERAVIERTILKSTVTWYYISITLDSEQ